MQAALARLQSEFKGKIDLQHRDFPFRTLTFQAAEAGRCAGDQGKEDQMRMFLFNGQARWGRSPSPHEIWQNYAAAAGVDMEKWRSCMSSQIHKGKIERDKQLGISLGVEATPTIFVGKKKIVGAVSFHVLAAAVREQLSR